MPLAKPTAAGNAVLSIRYAKDERLGAVIELATADGPVKLVRSREDPWRYTATLNFDFDTFLKEQAERKAMAEKAQQIPIFDGREVIRMAKVETLDLAKLRRNLAINAAIRIPPGATLGWPDLVDPRRELLITDLSVVNDPERTYNSCSDTGNPEGAWTFATLMSNIANQGVTGISAEDLVENWVQSWSAVQTINTFPVEARSDVLAAFSTWPRTADGKLDLSKSPMRLLAIVNRLDLRENSLYGGGNAGEGRFVFGVTRLNGTLCEEMEFTVILEYGVPLKGCAAVHDYAAQWRGLGDIALGSPGFNSALQAVTDRFTAANAAPGKPNGSAINQIRTNELALGGIGAWELREFRLQADHHLHTVPVLRTPDQGFISSTALAGFINANAAEIVADAHDVPLALPDGTPFLAGASPNEFLDPEFAWNAPGISSADARHHFSLNTCNSCHGSETDSGFRHIKDGEPGEQAVLSQFLVGDGTLAAPGQFAVTDPFDASITRTFGDLQRRQQKLAELSGSCLASGLISELRFKPLLMTH